MSVLAPATVRALRDARAGQPLFANKMVAELFEAQHSRGSLKLAPSTEGGYVLLDTAASNAVQPLGRWATLDDAHAALDLAATRGTRR